MAQLVGCDPDEVVLGPSSTMLVRLLAMALRFAPGDEIVVTNLDHESNIAPWRELSERGVVVREWRFDASTGDLTLEALERVLTERTKLVCFPHVSNLFGTVHDAAAFVRRIHAAGALACVDGVAFAPHRRVDVRAIGADFYFLSLYKLSGPHEGLLYARRDRLRATRSLAFPFLGDDLGPYRLQPGNVNTSSPRRCPRCSSNYVRLGKHHGAMPSRSSRRTRRSWRSPSSIFSWSARACVFSAARDGRGPRADDLVHGAGETVAGHRARARRAQDRNTLRKLLFVSNDGSAGS
jgi:hypothetical protein